MAFARATNLSPCTYVPSLRLRFNLCSREGGVFVSFHERVSQNACLVRFFGAPPQTTVDLDDASQIREMGSGGAVQPMPVRDAVGALVRTLADPVLSPDMSEATLAPLRDELRARGQVGLEHDLRAFYMRIAPGEPAETAAAWVRELSETYTDDLEMLNASLLVKYRRAYPWRQRHGHGLRSGQGCWASTVCYTSALPPWSASLLWHDSQGAGPRQRTSGPFLGSNSFLRQWTLPHVKLLQR